MKQFLLIIMTFLPLAARADVVEINGIYYNLIPKSKQAEVTSNPNKYKGDVVIPESITYDGNIFRVSVIGDLAFAACSKLVNLSIPNSVTSIGSWAFQGCSSLTSLNIPNSVTSIGGGAFSTCSSLTSVTISNSVTSIESKTFHACSSLTSLIIPYSVVHIKRFAFQSCSGLTSITIPNSVSFIDDCAFYNCENLSSISIPNSVSIIESEVFKFCTSLSSIIIPNSVTTIRSSALSGCSKLTSITIPKSVQKIEGTAFGDCQNLADVYCNAETVPITNPNIFDGSYIEYATLHVPVASINAYRAAAPWKNFKNIVALKEGETPSMQKCETPSISYEDGLLRFACKTEGVEFVSEITDADIKKHYDASIRLSATYVISVFASKPGYDNSEVANATLCWIEQKPQTEGITSDLQKPSSRALLIKSIKGTISVEGADDGEQIRVYGTNGIQSGTAISNNGRAIIATDLIPGSIAIVKIGQKSVKTILK